MLPCRKNQQFDDTRLDNTRGTRKKVNMDFFMWCVVFPILCLLIIREKFPGLISKIVKRALIFILVLIAIKICTLIGLKNIALCVIFLPAVFIAGLFIFVFIDSKINRYKFR